MTNQEMAALLGEAADDIERRKPPADLSAIESIAADHPRWAISREHDGAAHGGWKATRGGVTLIAPSAVGLLVHLERRERDRLQDEYAHTYRVWRTPSGRYWMATALVDGVTPTLMEESAADLETRLRNPGRPIAAQYKLGDAS